MEQQEDKVWNIETRTKKNQPMLTNMWVFLMRMMTIAVMVDIAKSQTLQDNCRQGRKEGRRKKYSILNIIIFFAGAATAHVLKDFSLRCQNRKDFLIAREYSVLPHLYTKLILSTIDI